MLLFVGAAVILTSCHAPTELSGTSGRFVLTTVNGKPLPALVDTSAVDYGVVLADTIDLDATGVATRAFAFRRVNTSLGTDVVYPIRQVLAYRLGPGTTIEIGSFTPCPANASCIANDVGTLTVDGMELVSGRYGAAPHLTFVRVGDRP